jgi:hypothetical protein
VTSLGREVSIRNLQVLISSIVHFVNGVFSGFPTRSLDIGIGVRVFGTGICVCKLLYGFGNRITIYCIRITIFCYANFVATTYNWKWKSWAASCLTTLAYNKKTSPSSNTSKGYVPSIQLSFSSSHFRTFTFQLSPSNSHCISNFNLPTPII